MSFNIEEMNVVLKEQGKIIVDIEDKAGDVAKGAIQVLYTLIDFPVEDKLAALELGIKMLKVQRREQPVVIEPGPSNSGITSINGRSGK